MNASLFLKEEDWQKKSKGKIEIGKLSSSK